MGDAAGKKTPAYTHDEPHTYRRGKLLVSEWTNRGSCVR